MIQNRMILALLMLFALAGCDRGTYTHAYLVTHPRLLEDEYSHCQALSHGTEQQNAQCQIVSNAVRTVTDVIRQQRNDPEKFGLRILKAEQALKQDELKLQAAKAQLAGLKSQSTNTQARQAAEENVQALTKTYADKKQEVAMLLAILGMSSPQ